MERLDSTFLISLLITVLSSSLRAKHDTGLLPSTIYSSFLLWARAPAHVSCRSFAVFLSSSVVCTLILPSFSELHRLKYSFRSAHSAAESSCNWFLHNAVKSVHLSGHIITLPFSSGSVTPTSGAWGRMMFKALVTGSRSSANSREDRLLRKPDSSSFGYSSWGLYGTISQLT